MGPERKHLFIQGLATVRNIVTPAIERFSERYDLRRVGKVGLKAAITLAAGVASGTLALQLGIRLTDYDPAATYSLYEHATKTAVLLPLVLSGTAAAQIPLFRAWEVFARW